MLDSDRKTGFIRCYGLFWSADEVLWRPGAGNRSSFRILGRVGERSPKLRVCDFRQQRGIYVLYDDYGPYYVGLCRKQGLGARLKQHLSDDHEGRWDRFSWFGFQRVLKSRETDGTQKLGRLPTRLLVDSMSTIGDIEALLIQSLGTQHRGNWNQMRFAAAEQWHQVLEHEAESILQRVAS